MKTPTTQQRLSEQGKLLITSGFAAILTALATTASANLIAYEPFDYTAGTQLDGQNGGVGWASAWYNATVAGATIQNSGMTYAGLPTSGNSVLFSGASGTLNIFRDFPNITGTAGTSVYISFLGQRQGPIQDPATIALNPYPRGANVGFFDTQNATRQERATIGNSSNSSTNSWAFIPTGASSAIAHTDLPYTDVAWAVLRIDFVGDDTVNDNAYLFLNPDPSVEPDISTAAATVLSGDVNAFDYSGLDYVRPFIGGVSGSSPYAELQIDELRIGTTYADMSATVVPEPATVGLFALGGLALLVRRFKR